MTDWQPIATAPRDGRKFITYSPNLDPEDTYDVAQWDDDWDAFAKQNCGFQYVTHWQDFPPPPKEGA